MRWSRVLILGPVLAIAAAAVCATGAAAASRLVLSENGSVVAPGAYALDYHLTFDGGCLQESQGEVLTNGRATDKLVFGPPAASECLEEGYAVAGALEKIELKSAGNATLNFRPRLEIAEPGPCTYAFTKLTGEFPATIEVDIEGTGVGKLERKGSSLLCASTRYLEFDAVESGIDNEIFGAEVLA